jgi:molecular chaperone GrpE
MPSSRASEAEDGVGEQDHAVPRAEGRSDEQLAELTARNEALEDRHRRALADFENLRKRSDREVARRVTENRDRLLGDWLEVVDSVERALRSEHDDGPLAEGLRAVLDQMEAILARHGVERIGHPGEAFDPDRHEAIGVAPSEDAPDRTVAEVARSGFALGNAILRPAQVIVTRRAEPGG